MKGIKEKTREKLMDLYVKNSLTKNELHRNMIFETINQSILDIDNIKTHVSKLNYQYIFQDVKFMIISIKSGTYGF